MNKINKAIEMSDAKITFVSLVDKAANKRQFLITKADGEQANFSSIGKILKVDETTHYITGIVYEPLVEDTQGNFMTEEEIRKAAHWFAKNGDKVDIQHSFEVVDGVTVVENYITPCDMTIGDTPVIKGTWIMTVEVTNSDVWGKVQKGEVTGFSMGGIGKYSEVDTDLSESVEKKGVLKQLAGLFGYDLVKKNVNQRITLGEVKDKYNRSIKSSNFWEAQYALENVLRKYNWESDEYAFITDETAIKEALTDFSDIIQNLLLTPNIAKTLKNDYINKKETEESEMTDVMKTEIQAIIDESIKKAMGKPEEPKSDDKPADPITAEAIQKMIAEAIKKAAEPEKDEPLTVEAIQKMIKETVEPVLKARGLPSNLNGETSVEKNAEQHYLAGYFG